MTWRISHIIYAIIFCFLIFLGGCAGSKQFDAVPKSIDIATVPRQTIEVQAKNFDFIPSAITIKKGTLVTFHLLSMEGTHGFKISAFGVDERLEEGQMKTAEVYFGEAGVYSIKCSHFCGLGHFGMSGKITVE